MQNSPVDRGQLVSLDPHCIFWSNLHTYNTFEHCLDIGMQNGDEVSPSVLPVVVN